MLDAMNLIAEHFPENRDVYDEDVVIRYFLLKQVEIIGEASCKIDKDFKNGIPEVPWKKIEGTRHILVHDYFDVDWSILWDILTMHLMPLRGRIERAVHGIAED